MSRWSVRLTAIPVAAVLIAIGGCHSDPDGSAGTDTAATTTPAQTGYTPSGSTRAGSAPAGSAPAGSAPDGSPVPGSSAPGSAPIRSTAPASTTPGTTPAAGTTATPGTTGLTSSPPPATSAGPPAPPEPCGRATGVTTKDFWLPQPNGDHLAATTVGTGRTFVVFSHQTDDGRCGFWSYATALAKQHPNVTALLFSRCPMDGSTCFSSLPDEIGQVVVAVSWARSHGASRVSLVGASLGGLLVLNAAAKARPPVDAVVSLSGVATYGTLTTASAVRSLRVPVLYVVAPDDSTTPVSDVRAMYAATSTPSKRLLVAPAKDSGDHGWDLLDDPAIAAAVTARAIG